MIKLVIYDNIKSLFFEITNGTPPVDPQNQTGRFSSHLNLSVVDTSL